MEGLKPPSLQPVPLCLGTRGVVVWARRKLRVVCRERPEDKRRRRRQAAIIERSLPLLALGCPLRPQQTEAVHHHPGIKGPRIHSLYIVVPVCMEGRWFGRTRQASKSLLSPCFSSAVAVGFASPHRRSSSRFLLLLRLCPASYVLLLSHSLHMDHNHSAHRKGRAGRTGEPRPSPLPFFRRVSACRVAVSSK